MYDLGSVVPLAIQLKDSTGALSDGGTVVCTVYLPDGSTATPTVVHPSVGSYYADYAAPMVGHYDVVWTITGTNADVITDSFDVYSAPGRFLCSLAEARAALNIPSGTTVDDDELRSYIAMATPVIELMVGPVLSRTITNELYDGNRYMTKIPLRTVPVASVTSVTESGVTLTAGSDYALDPGGLLRRLAGANLYADSYWLDGVRNISVTYKVGGTSVPPNINLAARELVREIWQVGQQGFTPVFGGTPGAPDTVDVATLLTPRIRQLCAPHKQWATFG